MTDSDSGEYFSITNYPILKAVDDTNILERELMRSSFDGFAPVISPPPLARSDTAMFDNLMDNAANIWEELDGRMKAIDNLESKLQDKGQELIIHEKDIKSKLEKVNDMVLSNGKYAG